MNLFRKLANRTTPIDETALHYIWLSLACGFASAAARELISAYHGAGAVYAEEDFSSRTDLSEPLRKRLSEKDLSDAQEIYKACREKGIGILTYESDLYPSRLRTLTNPPAVLYYRGRITNLDCEPCVAVVGTRSVSRYGEEVTDWFGYELAKSGAFVVSGLAKGADGIAHRAALRAGKTHTYRSHNAQTICGEFPSPYPLARQANRNRAVYPFFWESRKDCKMICAESASIFPFRLEPVKKGDLFSPFPAALHSVTRTSYFPSISSGSTPFARQRARKSALSASTPSRVSPLSSIRFSITLA